MDEAKQVSLGYLVSRYPAVSHTFIQREIHSLRSLGFTIRTASINRTDIALEKQTLRDKEEMDATYFIKEQGFLRAACALCKTFIEYPSSFLKGFCFAISWAGWDLKKTLWHLLYLGEACLVGNWMKKEKIRHLHVHFANPASSVAVILTKIFPFTFSMTVHGPDEFFDVTLNRLHDKFFNARFVICISHYACSQVMRLLPFDHWPKISIVRMGVDPELYAPKLNESFPSGSRQGGKINILCVGRLTPAKGQAILLGAFAQLANGIPAFLHFVGEGPMRSALEDYAFKLGVSSKVIFHGALNPEQTLACLHEAEIFVLPSFAEGIPVSLMEAMSIEIPCISTLIDGIPELILSEVNGWLVRASDQAGLTVALTSLCDDPSLRSALGKAGRKQILQHYDLAKNTENLAQVFKKHLIGSVTGQFEELS